MADRVRNQMWWANRDQHHAVEHMKLACALCDILGWGPDGPVYDRFSYERDREEHRR